jgi:CheY-like chemotaxis protein
MSQSLNVFIVEDSLVQRMHAVAICEDIGLTVIGEASDGGEALLLLQTMDLPDIMLIDLEMPGMDGIQLIQELAHQSIPVSVIVSSAKEDALIASVETMLQAYGLPVLGAIKKPLTKPQIKLPPAKPEVYCWGASKALVNQEPPKGG